MSKSIENDVEENEDPRNFWIGLLNTHLVAAVKSSRDDGNVTDEEERFINLLNRVSYANFIELSFYYSGLYNDVRNMLYGDRFEEEDDDDDY